MIMKSVAHNLLLGGVFKARDGLGSFHVIVGSGRCQRVS